MLLGLTPQFVVFPPLLRVGEVIALIAAHYADPLDVGECLELLGLSSMARRQPGALSGGQRRLVAIAGCFVGRPTLVVLDEPTVSLDAASRQLVWHLVHEFAEQGGAMLLASHDFREVEELAAHVVMLNRGSCIYQGTAAHLRAQPRVARVRFTALSLPPMPSAVNVTSVGDRYEVLTTDQDELVRELVLSGVRFEQLEVTPATLEEAYSAVLDEEDE